MMIKRFRFLWLMAMVTILLTLSFCKISWSQTGSISGTVTDSQGYPVADVDVYVWDAFNNFVYSPSQLDGTYTITGLLTGSYKVEFYDPNTDILVYYNEKYDFDSADIVSVTEPYATTGINAVIMPHVDISIAGILRGSYSIPPGGRVTPQYAGVMDGPVLVVSNGPVFASERSLYGGSFNEVMGYPYWLLTAEYWFPWYDQVSMNTWILVGNPDESLTANVDIYIAGILRGSYSIPPGGRVTPQYAGVMDGPVHVVSTIPVFASERSLYGGSFNEVMGYPDLLLDTEYWFPWYDQVSMNTWILVGTPN